MHRWFLPLLLLIAVGALALRVPRLDLRPMHNDENVNAIKIQALWERGEYQYDPHEYHGPSLYYLTLPFIWLSGAANIVALDEATLRMVPVAFGVGLILLLGLLRDGLGRAATLVAAGLTAISPAMVFYSRYYIHEMLLVVFSLMLLAGIWRYWQSPHPAWAALAGLGLGLMYATKETFVLALAAMGLAGAATLAWNRWRDRAPIAWKRWWNAQHFFIALAVATVVSLLLFTSFFTHLRGPLDSLLTYLPWTKRAGGHTAHLHPWYFYFERLFFYHQPRGLFWSEGLVLLLAVVGWGAGLWGRHLGGASRTWVRFLGFYTLFLSGIYSVIAYKTPWCCLGFYDGMILLAGVGAVVVWRASRRLPWQLATALVLVLAAGHLGWQAWLASYGEDRRGRLLPADRQNPYVYAQTLPDILELVAKVKGLARVHPDGNAMVIKVMSPAGDYLPLPWYLRQFQRIGWWDEMPKDPYAPVMIVDARFGENLLARAPGPYYVSMFSLRETTYYNLYVEAELWERYVRQLSRGKIAMAD